MSERERQRVTSSIWRLSSHFSFRSLHYFWLLDEMQLQKKERNNYIRKLKVIKKERNARETKTIHSCLIINFVGSEYFVGLSLMDLFASFHRFAFLLTDISMITLKKSPMRNKFCRIDRWRLWYCRLNQRKQIEQWWFNFDFAIWASKCPFFNWRWFFVVIGSIIQQLILFDLTGTHLNSNFIKNQMYCG